MQKIGKQTSSDISSDHKLSFKPKIMKLGSRSGEIQVAEKSGTEAWKEGRKEGRKDGQTRGFWTPLSKANSLRSLRSLRE